MSKYLPMWAMEIYIYHCDSLDSDNVLGLDEWSRTDVFTLKCLRAQLVGEYLESSETK